MWQPCRQAHTLRHSEHPDICKSTEVNNAQQAWEMETTVLGQNLLADEGVDARLTNLHPQSAHLAGFRPRRVHQLHCWTAKANQRIFVKMRIGALVYMKDLMVQLLPLDLQLVENHLAPAHQQIARTLDLNHLQTA